MGLRRLMMAGAAGPTDPYFASVAALLHFNGSNGSTTFVDQKANTWTASANAQIDTSTKQFGTASGHFSAVGSYIDANIAAPGTSDCTFEGFARWSGDVTNLGFLLDWRPPGSNGNYPTIYIGSGGVLHYFVNGSDLVSGGALSTSTFTHWAYSRVTSAGVSSGRLFLGGAQIGPTVTDSVNYLGSRLRVAGSGMNGAGGASLGWMDDLRVTIGVGRYASNFTPPTAAFPDS